MMTAAAGTLLNRESAYTTPRADVSALVPREAMRILDVGCSNGALGASLRAEVAGRRVVGIELDAGFARQAALLLDRVEQADLDAFDWSVGLGDERFDCIVFADVLEHRQPEPTLFPADVRGLARTVAQWADEVLSWSPDVIGFSVYITSLASSLLLAREISERGWPDRAGRADDPYSKYCEEAGEAGRPVRAGRPRPRGRVQRLTPAT